MRALLLAAVVAAAPASAQIATGDAVPLSERVFASADGAGRTLAGEVGPGGLLVVFWSNTCPWAQRYAARLAELVPTVAADGVETVLVNSNAPARLEAESAEATRVALADVGIAAPALLDADGALARAFGARRAPHAFLFGPDGRLRYDGAIDDSPSAAERVERAWLREAVADAPAVVRTPSFGCRLRTAADTLVAPAVPAP